VYAQNWSGSGDAPLEPALFCVSLGSFVQKGANTPASLLAQAIGSGARITAQGRDRFALNRIDRFPGAHGIQLLIDTPRLLDRPAGDQRTSGGAQRPEKNRRHETLLLSGSKCSILIFELFAARSKIRTPACQVKFWKESDAIFASNPSRLRKRSRKRKKSA
jgi:hypothetical protein